jgi:FkbH-like protein
MKEQLAGGVGDLRDYLRSLGMTMQVSLNNGSHLARLSQLTQKTNQLNLTTRRYSEHQVQEFITSPSYLVADFSLLDIFGNSGVAGLAIIHFMDERQAELDTFLMSCRVIGREAELAFLHFLLRQLVERGITGLVADYLPTAKNELLKEFLPSQGFAKGADQRYRWDLTSQPPQMESVFPIAIQWQG